MKKGVSTILLSTNEKGRFHNTAFHRSKTPEGSKTPAGQKLQ
jgi:hypothetical protein